MSESYHAAPDPVKGVLFKKDRPPRRDKGQRRRGLKIRHIKKIWRMIVEILTEKP